MKRMSKAFVALAVAGTMLALPGLSGSASAATSPCANQQAAVATAQHSVNVEKKAVAKDKKALASAKKTRNRAQQKLNAERKHHRTAAARKERKVVKKDNAKVSAASTRLKHNEASLKRRNAHLASKKKSLAACRAAQSNPLNALLTTLTGSGLSPAALTDALNSIASQVSASGAPGADQLASALDQVSTAIADNSGSIDPSKLQQILSQLPSSINPTAFQAALTQAAGEVQSELATPPTTAQGLVDDILNPLNDGLTTAGVPDLPGVVTQVQSALDGLLAGLPGLGSLSTLPGSGGTPIPGL